MTGTIKENDKAQELLLCRGPQGFPAWLGGKEEQGMLGGGVPEAALVSGEPKLEGHGCVQWCMPMTPALGVGFQFKASQESSVYPFQKKNPRKVLWIKALAAKLEHQILGHKCCGDNTSKSP